MFSDLPNFYSFKMHVYRKHHESLELSLFVPVEMDLSLPIVSDDTAGSTNQLEIEDEAATNSVTLMSRLTFEHMKKMALFLLKAREVRKVSQTALDGLLADFTIIIQETFQYLQCPERNRIPSPVVLLMYSSGNNTGNLHFVWKVSVEKEAEECFQNSLAVIE